MGVFQTPRQRRLIRLWQRFLTNQKLFSGKQDGADSATFRKAVSAFQHRCDLPQNGDFREMDTLEAAHDRGFDPDFEIGPDHDGDLRESRPYFVVPLDKGQAAMQDAYDRIAAWIGQAADQESSLLLRVSDTAEGQAQLPGEVQDPAGLVRRLGQAPPRSAAGALREQLTCDTDRRLKSLASGAYADWDLIRTIVNEINSLLAGPCLTDMAEHLGKPLPADLMTELKNDNISGQERLRVNRRLLCMAFPQHIPQPQRRGPVTDVFVFSHGWHRNFFAAVAAYDQLVSRFTLLLRRERLVPPTPFHPLFLALHWHSDPGQDGWVDKSGRRRKRTFMQLVEETFQRPAEPVERGQPREKRFTTVFEDVFQLFAQMSAPGTDSLTDQELEDKAHALAERLEPFSLREAPDADLDVKIVAVWSCYHQSVPIRILHDQDSPPKRFNSIVDSTKTLANFVLSIVGAGVVMAWIFHLPLRTIERVLIIDWGSLTHLPLLISFCWWLLHLPLLGSLFLWLERLTASIYLNISNDWLGRMTNRVWLPPYGKMVVVFLVCLVVLRTTSFRSWLKGPDYEPKNIPLVPVGAWLLVQVVFAAPLLLMAFLLFFVGGPIVWFLKVINLNATLGLYDERDGKRDIVSPPRAFPDTSRFRHWLLRAMIWLSHPWLILAWIARRPLSWVRECVALDSVVSGLADSIDNQFAFWEMQRFGVEAGREAGAFLEKMLTPQVLPGGLKDEALEKTFRGDVRLHFIGHSFGGLVVTNAVRRLTLNKNQADVKKDDETYKRVNVHSLTLLQAAIASNWFEKEETLRRSVTGAITNVYSRYDTANGFYYPLANSGRQAAGAVGLFGVGRDWVARAPYQVEAVGKGGRLASLVEPPDLADWATVPAGDAPYLLNLDASRLISEGNVALGGGHGDIFKDDVVNLIWAVTRLRTPSPIDAPLTALPDDPTSPKGPPPDRKRRPLRAGKNGTAGAAAKNGEGVALALVVLAQIALAATLWARRPP